MQLFRLHASQRKNVSRVMSLGIGALITHNPDFILYTDHMVRNKADIISNIYSSAHDQKEKLTASELNRILATEKFSNAIGFKITPASLTSRIRMTSRLEEGMLLQVTSHDQSYVYGKAKGKFWRYSSLDADQSATLTIYDNESQFRSVLRNHDKPQFEMFTSAPVEPKQKLRASM